MKKKPQDLRKRTKDFALAILKLAATLPAGGELGLLKRQLARAATSVGANYRAARRAKSSRDCIAKLSIVEEEADECMYWLELLPALNAAPIDQLRKLAKGADDLVAMMVASKKTMRARDH